MSQRESTPTGPLLEVEHLTVEYPGQRRRHPFVAVSDVTFSLGPNRTLGVVGESGSGKSTIGRAILGMTAVRSGRVGFRGQDITHLGLRERRSLSSELQVVFQDPYSSLNPTRTIGQTLGESLRHQRNLSGEERSEKIRDTLEKVGMPGDAARRYPGSFSGGQRQRIAIARAIIGGPRLIICDEPTSALDLSVQAQVLNLLVDLQRQFQLGYLFISHDLAVVRHMADEIIVLYRGEIVEQGDAEQVYSSPAHPYTKRLLAAAPVPDPARQRARHRELDELAV